VCGFYFQEVYGFNFIEAHHIVPLYKGERYTSKNDFIMLYANCHRSVHSNIFNEQSIDSFLDYMHHHR